MNLRKIFDSEYFEHMWANPTMNKKEIEKFESATDDVQKFVIGMNIIANNHRMRNASVLYDIESGEVFMVGIILNVPTRIDVESLLEEIGGDYDMDETFNYVTYYPQDYNYLSSSSNISKIEALGVIDSDKFYSDENNVINIACATK